MALNLYSQPHPEKGFDSYSPFRITFDGVIGGTIDQQIFLRNDDNEFYYTNITVEPYTSNPTDLTDGSISGFEWKLIEKDLAPLDVEWDAISAGNTISISVDLGNNTKADIITYIPIWIRVSVPRGQKASNYTDIYLRIQAQEYFVNGE